MASTTSEVAGISIHFSDVDKFLVTIFDASASNNKNTPTAIKSLIDFLQKCQRKLSSSGRGKGEAEEEGTVSQELNYAVRKVVQKIIAVGPRPHLILLLTELITFFSVLTIPWVLSLIKSISDLEADNKNAQQIASVLILVATAKSGKIATLIQHKRTDPSSLKQITTIVKKLSELAVHGGQLAAVVYEGLYQLIDQIATASSSSPSDNHLIFTKCVMPSIVPLVEGRWTSYTLLFVLKATDYFEDLDFSPVTKKLHKKKIVSLSHAELISSVFAHDIPNADSEIWVLLFKNMEGLSESDKAEFIANVWKTIAGTLAASKDDAKLFQFFNMFWDLGSEFHIHLLIDPVFAALNRQQDKPKLAPTTTTSSITTSTTTSTATSTAATLSAATSIVNKLKESCVADPTKTGATVLSGLPDVVEFLPEKTVTQIAEQLVARFYAAHQAEKGLSILLNLTHIARTQATARKSSEVVLEVLRLMFFHAFFIIHAHPKGKVPIVLGHPLSERTTNPPSSAKEDKTPNNNKGNNKEDNNNHDHNFARAQIQQIQQAFYRLLIHATSVKIALRKDSVAGEEGKQQSKKRKGEEKPDYELTSVLFSALVKFHHQIQSIEGVESVKATGEEEEEGTEKERKQLLTRAHQLVTKIHDQLLKGHNTQNNNSSLAKELDAFQLLLCMAYVNQIADPLEPISTIQDLMHCHDVIFAITASAAAAAAGAKKKQKTVAVDDGDQKEQAVIVLVDVLISFEAKPAYSVGVLPQYIIRTVSKRLTAKAIQGILTALTEPSLEMTNVDEDDEDDDEHDELNKIMMEDDNEEQEEEEEEEEGDEEEGGDDNSDVSDIMLDDLDDAAWAELEAASRKVVRALRKTKPKHASISKDPELVFKERVSSLLYAYVTKVKTAALLELIPALLSAIHDLQVEKIQQQQSKNKKKEKDDSEEQTDKSQDQRQRKHAFYKKVVHTISKIVKDICHSGRGKTLVHELVDKDKQRLLDNLSTICFENKGEEISELAIDSILLIGKSPEQLTQFLKEASSKSSKHVLKYLLHSICTQVPDFVWSNESLFSLLIENHPHQIQTLLTTIDIEQLKKIGKQLTSTVEQQAKANKIKVNILQLLRYLTQRMVSLTSREVVVEAFPNLAFVMNSITQSNSQPPNIRKLTRQISTIAFAGSQKQAKKEAKLKHKLQQKDKQAKEPQEVSEDKDQVSASPFHKEGLYFTKNKTYQKSLQNKKHEEIDKPGGIKRKAKKDTKWFVANGTSAKHIKK